MNNQTKDRIITILDRVYGKYKDNWTPLPYSDNKSRYLWTDAFGVINFLNLHTETGEERFLQQARSLVTQTHDVLGKTRDLRRRLDSATDEHPTRGGLRIGKVDESGSDGDGQYLHYLTIWSFALNRMTAVTSDTHYNDMAVELALNVMPRFFVPNMESADARLVWKMDINLSRPLVRSEGNLDPFDALVTFSLVDSYATGSPLKHILHSLQQIVNRKYQQYDSDDPLDLGHCLVTTHHAPADAIWARRLESVSLERLEQLWQLGYFRQPISRRLAFREFGTTIGVQVNNITDWTDRVKALHDFWMPHIFSRDADITPMMFCSSLFPGLFSRNYKSDRIRLPNPPSSSSQPSQSSSSQQTTPSSSSSS